jgi:hypothetical protein
MTQFRNYTVRPQKMKVFFFFFKGKSQLGEVAPAHNLSYAEGTGRRIIEQSLLKK